MKVEGEGAIVKRVTLSADTEETKRIVLISHEAEEGRREDRAGSVGAAWQVHHLQLLGSSSGAQKPSERKQRPPVSKLGRCRVPAPGVSSSSFPSLPSPRELLCAGHRDQGDRRVQPHPCLISRGYPSSREGFGVEQEWLLRGKWKEPRSSSREKANEGGSFSAPGLC